MANKSIGLYRSFALVGGLSWTFVICVILGAFLGTFIDNTFRIEPVFLIVGIIVGAIVGLLQSYRMIMRAVREDEAGQNDGK